MALAWVNVDFGWFFEVWMPEKLAKKSKIPRIFMLLF